MKLIFLFLLAANGGTGNNGQSVREHAFRTPFRARVQIPVGDHLHRESAKSASVFDEFIGFSFQKGVNTGGGP